MEHSLQKAALPLHVQRLHRTLNLSPYLHQVETLLGEEEQEITEEEEEEEEEKEEEEEACWRTRPVPLSPHQKLVYIVCLYVCLCACNKASHCSLYKLR